MRKFEMFIIYYNFREIFIICYGYGDYGPVDSEFARKACGFYTPGSNPTTTFTLYIYLNRSSLVVYQSFEYLDSAMHQQITLTYYKYGKSMYTNTPCKMYLWFSGLERPQIKRVNFVIRIRIPLVL